MNTDQVFSILTDQQLMSPREAADQLRIPRATVYQWIRRKKLPAVRLGGKILIRQDDLAALLTPAHSDPS